MKWATRKQTKRTASFRGAMRTYFNFLYVQSGKSKIKSHEQRFIIQPNFIRTYCQSTPYNNIRILDKK